ncbi:hypothetical protein T484DRAFT_1930153 [Baffinella frigidus]|nr:hypothetical protein T484DRAFT_1930153 [Cryptophyta sp. CCMP2293]|eukprot:CAMPEP_0180137762 /NCGR_PEP_ID=MMETSP0986-20121125/12442_1 /TAXON_ID=697907 /ORGANISM="non described non described, Strain CCMP2293" /LENGTH=124 /DNA_ID=CAMNT_0022079359 /DNA_START=69 /DNA_END=443 /DNA_ORIENTATION=-
MVFGSKIQAAARAVQGAAPRAPQSTQRRAAVVVPSAAEEIHVTSFEVFMFNYFGKDSAVIPGGIFITAVVLASGMASMSTGNQANQQTFMRARIGAQALTVAAMMASLAVQERQKALGLGGRDD